MAFESTVVPPSMYQRDLWVRNIHPSGSGNGTPLYSLYIIDLSIGAVVPEFGKFGFDVAPQQMRLSEEAAADVAALQDGGFYSDERGQYFKLLNVAGTFGFRPTMKQPPGGPFAGVKESLAQLEQAVNRTSKGLIGGQLIPPGERTGMDRFRDLHNLFRFYWDRKKIRSEAWKYLMVWADWKMGEVYFCQPMGFDRDRSVPAGRFKASYNFRLRLLAPVEVSKPPDFVQSPASAGGLAGMLDELKQAAKFLQAANSLLLESVTAAVDYGFDIVSAIYRPVDEALGFLDVTVKSAAYASHKVLNVAEMPVQIMRSVQRSCLEAAAVAYQQGAGYRDVAHNFMRTARLVQQAYIAMVAAFYKSDVNTTAQQMGDKYRQWDSDAATSDNPVAGEKIQGDRGSHTSLGSRKIPVGSKTITLPSRITLKALALNYLGSSGRWKEIALLNQLKPPYISPSGDGVTVLRPGQPIKIPVPPETGRDDNQVFNSLGIVRDYDFYRYGVDLRMDLDTKQLLPNGRGDLDVIGGLDNLTQAMHIKVWRKPGDLKAHPWFGFGAKGGEGIAVDRLAGYHLSLRMTLMSDTRVAQIKSMAMRLSGDILFINAQCVPKDSDNTLLLATRKSVR